MRALQSVFAVALVGLLTSCATIQPGSDPIVVNAERSTQMAYDTVDTFLKLEREHQGELAPQVHVLANEVRDTAPSLLRDVRVLTKTYKGDTTKLEQAKAAYDSVPEGLKQAAMISVVSARYNLEQSRASLNTKVQLLIALATRIQGYLPLTP